MKNLIYLLLFAFACSEKNSINPNETSSANIALREALPYDYKTKKTGLYSDTSVWSKLVSGQWVDAHNTPGELNNIFIESNHTLTLDSNFDCKNLNLNGSQDVVRLSTGLKAINVYGKLRTYTGAAPGTTTIANAGSGIAGWISGTIKFKGSSSRVIVEEYETSANSRSAGWIMVVAFDAGDTAKVRHTVRCGHLVVESGVLNIQGKVNGLEHDYEVRTAGDDYTAQPGNGVSGGTVLVKSGATLMGNRFRKNSPISTGNSLASFTLEAGSTLITNITTPGIAALTYDFSGKVVYGLSDNQNFITNMGNIDAIKLINYSNVEVSGSGSKNLLNDIHVGSLNVVSPAYINYNGFSIF